MRAVVTVTGKDKKGIIAKVSGFLADKGIEFCPNVVQSESVLCLLEFRIPFLRLWQNLLDDASDLFRFEVDSHTEISVANVLGEKSS